MSQDILFQVIQTSPDHNPATATATTETELISLTKTALSLLNNNNNNNNNNPTNDDDDDAILQAILNRISPAWQGHLDNYPHALSLTQTLQIWRQTVSTYPNFRIQLLDIGTCINERDRVASVYLQVRIEGLGGEEGMEICGFGETKWMRVRGVWMCCGQTGMRKGSSDSGIV